jgi:hypothetical protein
MERIFAIGGIKIKIMKDILIAFGLMLIPTAIIATIWVHFIDKSFKQRTQRNETVHQTIFNNI